VLLQYYWCRCLLLVFVLTVLIFWCPSRYTRLVQGIFVIAPCILIFSILSLLKRNKTRLMRSSWLRSVCVCPLILGVWGLMRSLFCVSPHFFLFVFSGPCRIKEAYDITLLSVCPPLMFSFSGRSVLYQRKAVVPGTSCKSVCGAILMRLLGVLKRRCWCCQPECSVSNHVWLLWYFDPRTEV
jgi:hypothetical protein